MMGRGAQQVISLPRARASKQRVRPSAAPPTLTSLPSPTLPSTPPSLLPIIFSPRITPSPFSGLQAPLPSMASSAQPAALAPAKDQQLALFSNEDDYVFGASDDDNDDKAIQ